jgi:hypothetical protein
MLRAITTAAGLSGPQRAVGGRLWIAAATVRSTIRDSYPSRACSWLIRDCRQWPLPIMARSARLRVSPTSVRRSRAAVHGCSPGATSCALPPFSPTPPSPCPRSPAGAVALRPPASPLCAGRRAPGVSVPMSTVLPSAIPRRGAVVPAGCWPRFHAGIRWARTASGRRSRRDGVRARSAAARRRADRPPPPVAAPHCARQDRTAFLLFRPCRIRSARASGFMRAVISLKV